MYWKSLDEKRFLERSRWSHTLDVSPQLPVLNVSCLPRLEIVSSRIKIVVSMGLLIRYLILEHLF